MNSQLHNLTPLILKLTKEQYGWIDGAAELIRATPEQIVMRLMELGFPHFDQELQKMRDSLNVITFPRKKQ